MSGRARRPHHARSTQRGQGPDCLLLFTDRLSVLLGPIHPFHLPWPFFLPRLVLPLSHLAPSHSPPPPNPLTPSRGLRNPSARHGAAPVRRPYGLTRSAPGCTRLGSTRCAASGRAIWRSAAECALTAPVGRSAAGLHLTGRPGHGADPLSESPTLPGPYHVGRTRVD